MAVTTTFHGEEVSIFIDGEHAATHTVSLDGWSSEAVEALTVAYRHVIDHLNVTTGLDFKATHTGGNVWNLTAELSSGREVCIVDSDGLHLDFDGEALDAWTAAYYQEGDELDAATVETDLTSGGALYAVAVVLLWVAQ